VSQFRTPIGRCRVFYGEKTMGETYVNLGHFKEVLYDEDTVVDIANNKKDNKDKTNESLKGKICQAVNKDKHTFSFRNYNIRTLPNIKDGKK
jgi:hypothetical protein